MTPEEKEEIINLAAEKALLALPEVVGNLMAQQASFAKINSQFYKIVLYDTITRMKDEWFVQ